MKKHLAARRERSLELGKQEAALRCAHCKTPLTATRIQMGERFCSTECVEDHEAFLERLAIARARR